MSIATYIFALISPLAFTHALHAEGSLELRHIPVEERARLRSDFEKASPLKDLSGKWTCDMYGVSSHIRVAKNVQLYVFSSEQGKYRNAGAGGQIVPVYSYKDGEMRGESPKAEDQLRRTGDGRLVSKLSHKGEVIAYSLCKKG